MRLLITDSDPLLIEIYHRFFRRRGCLIDVAASVQECLEKLEPGRTDALILDCELSGGGGRVVLSHMRQDTLLKQIPVMLLAGEFPRDRRDDLTLAPVVACFTKPFRLSALLDAVGACVPLTVAPGELVLSKTESKA